ncbi:MAG: 5'/3'-nucleotidase SurE [Aphanocapsa sp. GSE-SYN-MK-11-07L]|jgi:5'-nucleotidase|nr:5'/3'-nucleotidase SurE [Aphanocapsa sp. GSE-SYN-MK-11-07L]
MTWIVTNDDGIDAPGLQALVQAIDLIIPKEIARPTMIVAPRDHQSGCGHQVTTVGPIVVDQRSAQAFAVAGTPVDCVRLGLSQFCPGVKLVLSGINAGANLGVDAYISGTVAAVREAAFHQLPGIAISHYRQGDRPLDWARASRWTANVVAKLLRHPIEPDSFWNVNLPHLLPNDPDPDVVFCQSSTQPLPVNYRYHDGQYHYVGKYQERDRSLGTDVDVCFGGAIAITQIRLY